MFQVVEKKISVNLKCPHCEGKMYEEEFYFERKTKKVELGCYRCPARMYIPFQKYKEFLERKMKERGYQITYA